MSLKYDSIDKRFFFMSLNYDLNDKRFLFMSLKYDLNDKKFLFMSLKYDLNDKIFLFMSLNYDLNDKSLELVHTNIIHMDCNKFFLIYIFISIFIDYLSLYQTIHVLYPMSYCYSVYESDELKFNFFLKFVCSSSTKNLEKFSRAWFNTSSWNIFWLQIYFWYSFNYEYVAVNVK